MNRYLLFAGYHYYPRGGWTDFRHSFDSLEDAFAYGFQRDIGGRKLYDWCHVLDLETWEVTHSYG